MNLLILGSSVEDHIIRNGIEHISPGGIWFSSLAFSALQAQGDTLFLCTRLEKGKDDLFMNEYAPFEKRFITYGSVPRIHLSLYEDREREEHYENINEALPLPIGDIRCDGIYINMITGTELNPDDVRKIKSAYKCPVYLDIHSLARSIDSSNNRIFAPIPEAEKWIAVADFIQGNENEMEMLTGRKQPGEAIDYLTERGVTLALLTGAGSGVALGFRRNERLTLHISGTPVKKAPGSCVGCGDIFGASFFYTFLKTKNISRALSVAVTFGEITAFAVRHDSILADLRNSGIVLT